MPISTPEDIDRLELSRNPFTRHRQVLGYGREISPGLEPVGAGSILIGTIAGRGYLKRHLEARQHAEQIVALLDEVQLRPVPPDVIESGEQ